MASEDTSYPQIEIGPGKRLWVWTDDPPSPFEEMIASHLTKCIENEDVFYVEVYSWLNMPAPKTGEILSHWPEAIEVPLGRAIGHFHIGEELLVKVPKPIITYSNRAVAGDIRIATQEYAFCDQLMVVIGCPEKEHRLGHESLPGMPDAMGLLSLMFGKSISERPVIEAYFNAKTKKFVSGAIAFRETKKFEQKIYGLKSFYDLDRFSGKGKNAYAALWFAGKAFIERDQAAKIIFYHTAMELVCGKRMQDFFRRCYKGKPYAASAAITVRKLQQLRGGLLHQGNLGPFDSGLERYIQLLLLDALVYSQTEYLTKSAYADAIER